MFRTSAKGKGRKSMKIAAVTGGGQGIGRRVALAFGRAGYAVSMTGQNLVIDSGMTVKKICAE
jgi:NAD(P)-dependent dehydrogenase (short-subunit alcohol dehydrogenase family)